MRFFNLFNQACFFNGLLLLIICGIFSSSPIGLFFGVVGYLFVLYSVVMGIIMCGR